MTTASFPKLKRLVIICDGDGQISRIDATRFPALRHLVCMNPVKEPKPLINGHLLNFPPLLSLSFDFDADSLWLSVLQACQGTLISLELAIYEHPTMIQNTRLVFPRLICLDIGDWAERLGTWPLHLETPVLETYIEHAEGLGGSLMCPDATTITQLRMNRVPESLPFPRVQLIQLSSREDARPFLRHLSSNPAHFLQLETIEVRWWGEVPEDMVELVIAVNIKRKRAISLVYTSRLRDLHGMIRTQLVSFASRSLSGPITDAFPVWFQHAMPSRIGDMTRVISVKV